MSQQRPYRATVHVGGRAYSEVLDMDEIKLRFDEAHHAEKIPWDAWTRPVRVVGEDAFDDLRGNHLLFGWCESLFQSDHSPFSCLTDLNEDAEWVYEFE